MRISELIAGSRLFGESIQPGVFTSPLRSPFQADIDRITFSESFRALADKTQVVDRVRVLGHHRNRLTHSMEVASVGRTLGVAIGARMIAREGVRKSKAQDAFWKTDPDTIGQAVSASCLAHDLGNPPFGHDGEDTISTWFSSENAISKKIADRLDLSTLMELRRHEGNAQGFRTITRSMGWRENDGEITGLNLTAGTLAAFLKYPFPYREGIHKYGIFHDDMNTAAIVARATGMRPDVDTGGWRRHPLVWIMEAADDICYLTVDIEDAALGGVIGIDEAVERMKALIDPDMMADEKSRKAMEHPERALRLLRSRMIATMIDAAISAYNDNADAIMEGTMEGKGGLLDKGQLKGPIAALRAWSTERIYKSEDTKKIRCVYKDTMTSFLSGMTRDILDIMDSGSDIDNRKHNFLSSLFGAERSSWKDIDASTACRRAIDLLTMTPERRIVDIVGSQKAD